jgi:hypothetical protein
VLVSLQHESTVSVLLPASRRIVTKSDHGRPVFVPHLVDCVLPAVPIRQFVLSSPFELSLLAATKPEVLRALARIHAEGSAKHLSRVKGGLLYAATSNVPWATLPARTFEVDVKSCVHCGGRLEVRAVVTVVTDHDIARKSSTPSRTPVRAPPTSTERHLLVEPELLHSALRQASRFSGPELPPWRTFHATVREISQVAYVRQR